MVERDLDDIQQEGILRAITVYSETSYFLYRGQPMGFEYELLQRLADHLEVALEIIPAEDLDQLINMLNRGEGDLIAYGLTVTQPRQQYVDFSNYLYLTKQVLVQRKPDNWRRKKLHEIEKELVSDPIELIGDTVAVRLASSYYERLQNLEQEIGGDIVVDTLPGKLSTGRIIKKVVQEEIEYTVADDNIAEINSAYYPSLDVETPISFSQRSAWAVRKNAPELRKALNAWIKAMRNKVDYYVIYDRYFENKRDFRARIESDFFSQAGGKISRYDTLVKRFADTLNWDWRFLSSLIYQESQFDPNARSWAKARGLMQLMPATARELGVRNRRDPLQNLQGGTAYLEELYERWEGIPDSVQRVKFTLASYNCGYHHVVDAQRLAEENGANPQQWDDAVEQYLLKLAYPKFYNAAPVEYGYVRGIEPVTYVKQIFERYQRYRQLIPEERTKITSSY
jgi:membrane-bound lytic murein transglycosylase F